MNRCPNHCTTVVHWTVFLLCQILPIAPTGNGFKCSWWKERPFSPLGATLSFASLQRFLCRVDPCWSFSSCVSVYSRTDFVRSPQNPSWIPDSFIDPRVRPLSLGGCFVQAHKSTLVRVRGSYPGNEGNKPLHLTTLFKNFLLLLLLPRVCSAPRTSRPQARVGFTNLESSKRMLNTLPGTERMTGLLGITVKFFKIKIKSVVTSNKSKTS